MRNYSIEGSEEERTALLVDNDIQNNSYSSIERERVICRGYESNNESKKFTGGLISGSLALLSDSFHLLSDVIGFLISLIAVIVSQKKATKKYSFGYHRAEIIGALLSLVFIWVLTIGLIIGAINRLKNPVEINAKVMLITSIAGVIINIILALTLEHGHSHSHSHGHSHGHSHSHSHGNIQSNNHEHEHHVNVNEHHVNEHEHHINEHNNEENGHNLIEHYEKENINVKAAIIHIVGDLISSIGVVIAAVIIYFDPSKVYIDPICTFIFSIIVIFTTINLLKQALSVIMESTPDHIDPDKVKKDLSEIKGIVDIHDLHIWNITVGKPAIAAHINVKKENPVFEEYERILNNAQFILCTKYNIHHTTLQIEYINEEDHPLLDYNSSSSSSTQNNKNVTIDIQPLDNNYREYSSIHCNTEL